MYIVELTTNSGKICESYASYREACHRVNQYPAEDLVGLPLIYRELADGSQRLVREDGKPLQWHRLPWDEPEAPDEPLPLTENLAEFQSSSDPTPLIRAVLPPDDDDPIPLCE